VINHHFSAYGTQGLEGFLITISISPESCTENLNPRTGSYVDALDSPTLEVLNPLGSYRSTTMREDSFFSFRRTFLALLDNKSKLPWISSLYE